MSKLFTDHTCIHFIPAIVTHCPPYSIVANLYSSFSLTAATDKPYISISAITGTLVEYKRLLRKAVQLHRYANISYLCKSPLRLRCAYILWFLFGHYHNRSVSSHCFYTEHSTSGWVLFRDLSMLSLSGVLLLVINTALNSSMHFHNYITEIPMSLCPSCLHTVVASLLSQPSSHTVPQ